MLKILAICDSFKGTLSSSEVGKIVCEHYNKEGHDAKYIPISDGGEGFLEVIKVVTNLEYKSMVVNDPLFNKTNAKYLYDENQKIAYIELAEASGLTKIPNDKKDAVKSSTYGLGQLMKKVIEIHHPKKIVLGIGGSATTDMGAGMLEAMGVEFLDDKGFKLTKMNNSQLMKIRKMNLNYFKKLIKGIEFVTLTDVQNPVLGELGTVRVFAPQKGAKPEYLFAMEQNVKHFYKCTHNKLLKENPIDFPGAGAAGGVGYTMRYYFGSSIKAGIDTLLELVNFSKLVKEYDVVFSGEGKIDSQTLNGKVISGIKKYHPKRLILIGGSSTIDSVEDEIYPIVPNVATIEESMSKPIEMLEKLLGTIKL